MNDQLKKDEKNGDITEDELRSGTEDVQSNRQFNKRN